MKARVLAFLQNMWFPRDTPQATIDMYLTDQKFRRCILAKSMSGKRLVKAFGPHYRDIWWENASPQRGEHPGAVFPADTDHMWKVIYDVKPDAILGFGSVAAKGLNAMFAVDAMVPLFKSTDPVIFSKDGLLHHTHFFPHPNCRGLLQWQLDQFAKGIIDKHLSIP